MSNLSAQTDLTNLDFGTLDVVPFVEESMEHISNHPMVQGWFGDLFHLKTKNTYNNVNDPRDKQIKDRLEWLEDPANHSDFEHFDVETDREVRHLREEQIREKFRNHRLPWDNKDFKQKLQVEVDAFEDEVVDAYETEDMADAWMKLNKYGFTWGGFAKFLLKIRWILNVVFFAVPWILIGIVGVIYNLYFNIFWNKIWAGGNYYLMANTIFLLVQTLLSIPLVAEFPPWMRHMGLIRLSSVFNAYVYNGFYFGFIIAYLLQVYEESDEGYANIGTFDIMMAFFFMYNTILHSSLAIINSAIIIKEDQLEWFELFTSAGGKGSDYYLTWEFAKKSAYEDVWFLDPVCILKNIAGKNCVG